MNPPPSQGNRSLSPLIPRRLLFGEPEKISPLISPCGQRIAYLAPRHDTLNVWLQSLDGSDPRPLTEERSDSVASFWWGAGGRYILYLKDRAGNQQWHLWALDLNTGDTRDLTPFEGVSAQKVADSPAHPGQLLAALNREDPSRQDVYRIWLDTGRSRLEVENPGTFTGWIADAGLVVRAALSARSDGGFDLMVRETGRSPWRKALDWDLENGLGSGPIGFTPDGRGLYLVDSRGCDTSRLVRLDLATGEVTTLAGDDRYDLHRWLSDPIKGRILAVSFLRQRNHWLALDDSVAEDLETLAGVERGDFHPIGHDAANRRWIVAYLADNLPVSFFLYDRDARSASFLFNHQPGLLKYRLAKVRPIALRARDGLRLEGYLTRPIGAESGRVPMVLKVHGGPWTRDQWDFDPETQWLANRGYACLSVNFRGSTGYGKSFLNAGNREWGGKMQEDLEDAVDWALAEGHADPSRLAVMGISYGGYAALMAAASPRRLFRCAIDVAGPTDLVDFTRGAASWGVYRHIFLTRVGDPDKDRDLLASRSPLRRAVDIQVPVLVAHGENDPRVPLESSRAMVEALRQNGVECEFHIFSEEGHGIGKSSHRLDLYAAMERFLARHLGGRVEETGTT